MDKEMKLDTRSAIALLLIVAELVALWLVSIPNFNFAFSDEGSNLTVQYLVSRGLVPGRATSQALSGKQFLLS